MKASLAVIILFTLVSSLLVPATALADSDTHTYELFVVVPNVSEAANGDQVAITARGTWQVHPNRAIDLTGTFTHRAANGTVLGAGIWTATDLLEYQSYGCGVVHNFPTPGATTPLPPNWGGGAVKMRILATPSGTNLQIEAILTVFCIIGPNPPNSHDDPTGEGITLVVPGIANFNHIVVGMNHYVQLN